MFGKANSGLDLGLGEAATLNPKNPRGPTIGDCGYRSRGCCVLRSGTHSLCATLCGVRATSSHCMIALC